MSQTILIEDNEDKKKLYSINLNIFAGTDVVLKNGHEDTLALLKVHPAVDLIICKAHIKNQNTALEIYKFLTSQERKIPLIILGEESQIEKGVDFP